MKKWILISMAVVSILTGFLLEPFVSDVKMDNLIDYSMDYNNNFYFLRSNKDSDYYLIKTKSNGSRIFSKVLENPSNGDYRTYKQLDTDANGYVYVLYEDREVTESTDGFTTIGGIKRETIVAYSSSGALVKNIADVDLSQEDKLPSEPYIYKIQAINNKLDIICRKGNTYEVLTADVSEDKKPEVQQTFEISRDIASDSDLISEMAVTSNGKVAFSMSNGSVFAMNSDNGFVDITPNTGKKILAADISIDESDNIFFTDTINNDYYRLDISTLGLNIIYNQNSVVDNRKNIRFKDLKNIYTSKDGQYFAKYKNADNDKYVYFGSNQGFINNISQSIFPMRILIFFTISIFIFGILYLILILTLRFKDKITVNKKIMLSLVPLYIISMLILMAEVINISIDSYDNYLRGEQEISSHIMLDNIDKTLYSVLDPVSDYLGDKYKILDRQISSGFSDAQNTGNKPSQYVTFYKMREDKLYTFAAIGYFDNNSKIDFKSGTSLAKPIEYTYTKEVSDRYYQIWNSMLSNNYERESSLYSVQDNYGQWICVLEPIRDKSGNIIGMIQTGIDRVSNRDRYYLMIITLIISSFLGISAIVFVGYSMLIKHILKPLKEINKSVVEIGEGRWNTKLNIQSKDEFLDIGRAFNIMTDRMNQYISNLVILNKEYIRFVPLELMHLLGKKQITDITLNDRNIINANIVHVIFDKEYHKVYKGISEDKYFDMINGNFDLLFKVVENNDGVIQWFDSRGMLVLFPNRSEDAVKASMQFKEVFAGQDFGKYMKVLLGKGKAIIGITGNEKRCSINVISDEIMNMDYLAKHLSETNVKHFALEPIIKSLSKDNSYNYRFIGQIKHISKNESIKLYEFIDNTSLYDKNLFISTKPLFEKAVETYIDGNIVEARKLFASVLRINEEDKLSMYYLSLCDKYINQNLKDWNGYL
mgnify:CR=1 FL=1